jgi:peptidoglycan/LPS O-acetylase OafA/YrhL
MRTLWDLPRRFGRVTSAGTYVPQIDGIRFVMMLPVLFYHAALRGARITPDPLANEILTVTWLPFAGYGVSVFFFVSGFIIAYPFMSQRPPRLAKYYTRRLLRIEPPYVVTMIGCFIILSMIGAPSSAPTFYYTDASLWQSLLASLTYTHGLIYGHSSKLNPPTWSLEREMQFYMLAPFLVYAYMATKNRRVRMWFGAVIFVALLVLGEVIRASLPYEHVLRHTGLVESYGFWLGIMTCDYTMHARTLHQPADRLYDWAFVLGYIGLVIGGVFDPRIEHLSDADHTLGALAGIANSSFRAVFMLMVFAGAVRGTTTRTMLAWPWVTLIGGACYSIYLAHLPIMHLGAEIIQHVVHPTSLVFSTILCWAVLVPAAVAFGLLFYACVEHPCMRPDWPGDLMRAIRAWRGGTISRAPANPSPSPEPVPVVVQPGSSFPEPAS